jgi:hypothetical protein
MSIGGAMSKVDEAEGEVFLRTSPNMFIGPGWRFLLLEVLPDLLLLRISGVWDRSELLQARFLVLLPGGDAFFVIRIRLLVVPASFRDGDFASLGYDSNGDPVADERYLVA